MGNAVEKKRHSTRHYDSQGLEFGNPVGGDATLKHDGTTGVQLLIADNDADAFEIAQSTTTEVALVVSNGTAWYGGVLKLT